MLQRHGGDSRSSGNEAATEGLFSGDLLEIGRVARETTAASAALMQLSVNAACYGVDVARETLDEGGDSLGGPPEVA